MASLSVEFFTGFLALHSSKYVAELGSWSCRSVSMFPVSLREGRGGFASVIPGLTENGVSKANSGFSSS